MPVDPLAEEFVAVAAIFPECVSREGDASRTIKIHPRSSKELNTPSLTLNIPLDYPQSPPTLAAFMGISPSIAQNLLQSSWSPGEVCLYPLIESLRETLSADLPVTRSCDTSESISNEPRSEVISNDIEVADLRKYAFATSAAIVDRKSVFVGRAIEVHSRAEAQSALLWLKENDKKVARATHNIVAWRFMENGVLVKGPIIWLCDLIQDNDDDGEDAAGARIAHLLEIMVKLCVAR